MQELEIAQLRILTDLLKDKFAYDFSNYAMSSFRRRIQRILEIYKFSSFDALLDKLNEGGHKFFHEYFSESYGTDENGLFTLFLHLYKFCVAQKKACARFSVLSNSRPSNILTMEPTFGNSRQSRVSILHKQ